MSIALGFLTVQQFAWSKQPVNRGNESQAVDRTVPSPDEKAAALRRVLDSGHFGKAARLRDFLEYVGRHSLDGAADSIHEVDIGREVYKRPLDYTPAEDSIVRVEARNLRRKLEAFYTSEGSADPIEITIPKGAYVPQFEFRESETPVADPALGSSPARKLIVVLCGVLAASLAANFQLASTRWSDRESPGVVAELSPEALALWSALFRSGQETYIILPDSLHAMVQDVAQRSFSLRDYQAPGFSPLDALAGMVRPSDEFVSQVAWRQYTGLADSKIAARIFQLSSGTQAVTSIRFARNMHTRDFKGRNLVLLGSSRSNPWRELFSSQLNFTFEYDAVARRPFIRNRHPQQGEQERYIAGVGGDNLNDVYAAISLVRNLTDDGYVLMVAGTSMEGTEAAGEFLLSSDASSGVLRDLIVADKERLRPFEVLVQSSRMEGVSRGAKIVARRVKDPL